jgi:hypothetical protein
MSAPSTPWTRAFRRRELPEPTTTNAKDFADSVNARCVMPTKSLLDLSRDCSKYFTVTDVAAHREKPQKQPLRRAK